MYTYTTCHRAYKFAIYFDGDPSEFFRSAVDGSYWCVNDWILIISLMQVTHADDVSGDQVNVISRLLT